MNPFSPKHPASPQYFVNRKIILQRFKNQLLTSAKTRPPKPDNIAILGGWGIGKTSALQKLEDICLSQKAVKTFTALIELTPETCTSFEKFANRTRDEIERSFKTSDMSLLSKLKRDLIPGWRLKTIELGIVTAEKELKNKSIVTSFEDSLRELWKILSKSGVEVAVLMFDDLHYMAQQYVNGLYDIRGIFQGLPKEGCNFMLAIAGSPYLFNMAREFAEPFTRFFDRFYLEPFSIEETRNFITVPLSLSKTDITVEEDVIEKIYKLTKGHPYFLSFIMKNLVDLARNGNISLKTFNKVYPTIAGYLSMEKFNDDITQASEIELKVLQEMASINTETISPSQLSIKNARKCLKLLTEKKGLVVKTKRGEYSLYHPLFKEYLLKIIN